MINSWLRGLESVFSWLLEASWQASVLVALVLLLQLVLRGRLNPRWHHALWLLVIARLMLPFLPESALSLYQFAPPPPAKLAVSISEPLFAPSPLLSPIEFPSVKSEVVEGGHPLSFYSLLAITWLVGAVVLLLLTWQVNRRFTRHVAASPLVTDPRLINLAEAAQQELGLHRQLRIIESPQVKSPAIMGLFRPTLILPKEVRARFDDDELRFIFLHEFAHLKRGDLFLQWLIASLQILHWFNPILWYGFRRMRTDREPATDALVLSCAGEMSKDSYGQVLVKLLEHYHTRNSLPTLVGILEDKDQFKRRFSLILKFTSGAYGWSLLGVVLISVLAIACLTKAKAAETPDTTNPSAQTYLEVSYVETADTSAMPGGMTTTQGAAKSLVQNPKNKHVILNDFALKPGMNTLRGNTPWGADFAITLNWSNYLANTAQDLALKMEWPHANGGDVSYGIKFKASLRSDECFVVTGPWKTKETSNLLISFVDHPSEEHPKGDASNQATALLMAVSARDLQSIKDLLKQGVDPNAKGQWGTKNDLVDRPIAWAITDGNIEVAQLLLDHGAKADDYVAYALNIGNGKMVKLFWDHGVRSLSELSYQISQGASVEVLKGLLDRGSPVEPPQDTVMTPLAVAAAFGNKPAIDLLLGHGADPNKCGVFAQDTWTRPDRSPSPDLLLPLGIAAEHGQDEIVEDLLIHGVQPTQEAILLAVERGSVSFQERPRVHFENTVKFLIGAGALKNIPSTESGKILYVSIYHGGEPDLAIIKMLLDAGLSPQSTYTDTQGKSLIDYVRDERKQATPVRAASLKLILDILEAANADASSPTPASVYVGKATNSQKNAQSLADPKLILFAQKLDAALRAQDSTEFDKLLYNVDVSDMQQVAAAAWTQPFMASLVGNTAWKIGIIPVADIPSSTNSPLLNANPVCGFEVLHAFSDNNRRVVFPVCNINGEYSIARWKSSVAGSILETVKNGDTAALQTLLGGGMPPNAWGIDPAYWAVYFDHQEILKILLAHGAKVDRRFPPENVSPMELARKLHPELLSILQAAAQKSGPKATTESQPSTNREQQLALQGQLSP